MAQRRRVKLPKWFRSGVLGSLAAVLAAVLLAVKAIPSEGWIVVVLLFASAAAIALRELLSHREAVNVTKKERLASLRCPPEPVRRMDPFALGVTPSEIADRYRGPSDRPPYVKRDIDIALDRFLRQVPFVAVVGPSKAGKTRTAFEALSRVFPDRLLVAPELPGFHREGMANSISAYIEGGSAGMVIWLDDLQEFLRTRAIATQDVNAWRSAYPDVVVVATIRDRELAALRDTANAGTDVQRIVDLIKIVPLDSHLSERELAEAESAYPDEDFRDGLGVHLVAGQQLIERFITAREVQPVAFAIAAAAIDRRRAGVMTPASKQELLPLMPSYLRQVRPRGASNPSEVNHAFSWATETIIQDIALLSPVADEEGVGYEPFEYMTAYRDGDVASGLGKADIPGSTWAIVIEQNAGWELHSIGWSAMARAQYAVAEKAFEKLAGDADPHIAAHGVADLANSHWELGNLQAARECYEAAAATGFPCIRPTACYHAALLTEPASADAEMWYRRAIVDPKAAIYPKASVNLGLLLRVRSNVKSRVDDHSKGFFSSDRSNLTDADHALEAEAIDLFEAALDSTDQEAISAGGNALGVLLKDQGRVEEAEVAFQQAIEAGSAYAAIAFGGMLAEQGRPDEGRKFLSQVEGRTLDDRERAYLKNMSAQMARNEGDYTRARRELRAVVEEGAPMYVDSARMTLAELLLEQDASSEEARTLLQEVVLSGGGPAEEARRALTNLNHPSEGRNAGSSPRSD